MNTSLAIAEKLESIVGPGHVCAASPRDVVAGVQPEYVVSPGTERELAAVLASANEAGIAVIPRGGGTKLDWGNPPKRAGMILSTLRMNRVLEHPWADLTVSVEAGCTLQALQDTLAKHGQRLALDALWPERATVGGVLSSNDSGALRLRFGSLRDLIIGVTLALPDGTLASSGGKVVKNVAGYDLPKLATGAFGTLGIITRAIFRLHPLPLGAATLTCATDIVPKAERLIMRLLDSQLAYTAVQTRFIADKEPQIFTDVLFEGTQAGIAAQAAHVKSLAAPLSVAESDHSVWQFRETLHSRTKADPAASALIKMSALPNDAIRAMGNLCTMLSSHVQFDAVIQATGLGTIFLTGDASEISRIVTSFRKRMESAEGTVIVFGSTPSGGIDAWGDPSDASGVMRALKQELDPRATLNPGRFVGGI